MLARYAEKHAVKGIIIVSGCVTDLGNANERASGACVPACNLVKTTMAVCSRGACLNQLNVGYYNRPWDWAAMRANTSFIHQFASQGSVPLPSCMAYQSRPCPLDDPFIPLSEMHTIRDGLQLSDQCYHEYTDKGHFMTSKFPELLQLLKQLSQAA